MPPVRRPGRPVAGVPLVLATILWACTGGSGASTDTTRAQVPSTDTAIVAEARTFMEGYARDLLAGDRAAIAARYDRTGAFALGNGHKRYDSHDSIVAQYAGSEWRPPAAFEWRDLTFEPLGPDAVVVAGLFSWTMAPGAPPMNFSYLSLLRRQDGALRIRIEDESLDPASIPRSAAPPQDSARR